jgi:heterodisulfide reductase subunit C
MAESAIKISGKRKSAFLDKVKEILPDGGNLNACLTCGACSSGCPATGIEGMDPRKFLRMAAFGMDDEILKSKWVWACTMCQRCVYVCPMKIDIPQLIFNARASWPREERPKGILGSCDAAAKVDSGSAMGLTGEMFQETAEELLEEVREEQKGFEKLEAPFNKKGAKYFLNQNSREPQMEEDEMVPLWKILNKAGVDWTTSDKGWAAENYCMFLADDDAWEKNVRLKANNVDELGCKVWLNTE